MKVKSENQNFNAYVCTTFDNRKLVIGTDKNSMLDVLAYIRGKRDQQQQETVQTMKELNLKWKDSATIHIFEANITTLHVDAIVNAADASLTHDVGVAASIARAAGQEIHKECDAKVRKDGPLPVAGTYVSKGYYLPCKYVIHAVGPMWHHTNPDPKTCEELMYKNICSMSGSGGETP